jgi:hypothetical protein
MTNTFQRFFILNYFFNILIYITFKNEKLILNKNYFFYNIVLIDKKNYLQSDISEFSQFKF